MWGFSIYKHSYMNIQLNYKVGDKLHHAILGEGEVIAVLPNYTLVDYPSRKAFNMANRPNINTLTETGKPAIEIVFNGPTGTYEVHFEYQARPTNPESSSFLKTSFRTITGKTEADAVKEVKETVKAYKNYDSSFAINSVTQL
jgi:hypothetical protein